MTRHRPGPPRPLRRARGPFFADFRTRGHPGGVRDCVRRPDIYTGGNTALIPPDMKRLTSLLAGAALIGTAITACAELPEPAVGTEAPAFTVTDTSGKSHSLSDFTGKIVVLEWLNFDCPFVARHYKSGHLPALQKKVTDMGGIWLAVNSSAKGKQGHMEPDAMKARGDKEGFAGTAIVFDTEGAAGKAYGAPVTPTIAIIDAEGKLRYWGGVDDDPRGNKEDAVDYITAAVTAISEGKEVATPKSKPYGCGVKY